VFGRGLLAGVLAALVAAAVSPALAGAQDPSGYCVGDGGAAGQATDAEHTVLVGDPPPPSGVRESRISVGGVHTRVIQAGPAHATTAVVFLHGSPDSARDWDDLVAANGRFARTIAFDFPGYGKSDKGAARIETTDGAADYVQGVLDRLAVKRVMLVMHDFGGTWGLQWAVRHRGSLLGAVLIDAGVLIDYVPHPLALVWSTPGAGEAEMASTTRESWRANFAANSSRGFPDGYVDRLYDYYDRATRCAILRYYRSASQTFMTIARDQAAALRPLDLPALVIWGEQDQYVPVKHAEDQKQAFPHARIELIADSGHWPHIDNAARVRSLVVPWLRPKLRPSVARVGRRRVHILVRTAGRLPAFGVRARLGRHVSRTRTVAGSGLLGLPRPSKPGLYRVVVRGRGLHARHLRLRVR
jgi:pimeloyl-ACP methyl ester carboxylesterase